MKILAKDYLEKMGFGDQPYIVYKHEDIGRHHIHVDLNRSGNRNRRSRPHFMEFRCPFRHVSLVLVREGGSVTLSFPVATPEYIVA